MTRAFLVLCLFIAGALAGPAAAEHQYGPGGTVPLNPDFEAQWVAQLRKQPAAEGTAVPVDLSGHRRSGWILGLRPGATVVAVPGRSLRSAAVAARAPAAVKPKRGIDPKYLPTIVSYRTSHGPGTIVIDPRRRFLYLVLGGGKAKRYGIGVGRDGFGWSGVVKVGRKAVWPTWTPPAAMRKRQPYLPVSMAGGPNNPLGARALYLYRGGKDTLYRIHGSNEPWTIGRAVSSGCFRMRNEDVIDLYKRVPVGAKVVVQ